MGPFVGAPFVAVALVVALGLAPTFAKDLHHLVPLSPVSFFGVVGVAAFALLSTEVTIMLFLSVARRFPLSSYESPDESPVMVFDSTRRSPPVIVTFPSILAMLVDDTSLTPTAVATPKACCTGVLLVFFGNVIVNWATFGFAAEPPAKKSPAFSSSTRTL